jgi:4-hydroxybenzoate polyprenyltransferase
VGYAALVGSVPLAAIGDPVAGAACATCVALAILYSHPRILLKGHPLGGPLVNIVGYGLLSPLAGWATVDVSPNLRTALVWGLGGAGIFGTYLAAQAFQGEEDRARGYRTLVATAGPQAVLRLARAAIALAMIGGLTLAVVGWLPRTCLFGVIGWWYVDRHLSVWAERKGGGSERDARIFALRMSGTLVLGILLAFVEYAADSFAHRPVAGLGTEAGHPPDRVRYSQ